MGLKFKISILYIFYAIRLLIYRLIHGEHAEEFLVEKCHYPRIALKLIGVPVGKNTRIRNGLVLYNYKRQNLIVGDNIHIGKNVFLDLTEKITISNNCTISMGTKILTHLDLGDSRLKKAYPKESHEIILKEDVYLGAGCTVLHSTQKIEQRTLLAANSTLNKPTKGNSFYAGVPATFKKNTITN